MLKKENQFLFNAHLLLIAHKIFHAVRNSSYKICSTSCIEKMPFFHK